MTMDSLVDKVRKMTAKISEQVMQLREFNAKEIEARSDLDYTQATRVNFLRWLVHTRRIVGDLAEDVDKERKS